MPCCVRIARSRLPSALISTALIVLGWAYFMNTDSFNEIWKMFEREYLNRREPLALNSVHTSSASGARDALTVNVYVDGEQRSLEGEGNGPIAAFVDAIKWVGYDVRVLDYHEHALSSGGDAIAAAYVECEVGDQVLWGVGLDANIVTASLQAVISAVNRAG